MSAKTERGAKTLAKAKAARAAAWAAYTKADAAWTAYALAQARP